MFKVLSLIGLLLSTLSLSALEYEIEEDRLYTLSIKQQEWLYSRTRYQGFYYLTLHEVRKGSVNLLNKYDISKMKFCKGEEDACYLTQIKMQKFPFYPNPLLILVAHQGAHSMSIRIYNPYKKSLKEPIFSATGAYTVHYKVTPTHLLIETDGYEVDDIAVKQWP